MKQSSADASLEVTGEVEIVNPLGLHARAASKLVGLANKYGSDIWLAKDDTEVNAKSILGVLMLACAKGSRIYLRCHGRDATEAYQALTKLVADGFGEL